MHDAGMLDRLREARVARLATADAHGKPHLVPVVFALADDHIYSAVDHKPKKSQNLKRLRNVAENALVALLVDHYDDDWSQLWWVRVDATARVLETGDNWERGAEALAEKYPQYRGHPPDGAMLELRIERISGWSATA